MPRYIEVRSVRIKEYHHHHSTDARSSIEFSNDLGIEIPSLKLIEPSKASQTGHKIPGESNGVRTDLEPAGYSKNNNEKRSSADNRGKFAGVRYTKLASPSLDPLYAQKSKVEKPLNTSLSLKPQDTREVAVDDSSVTNNLHLLCNDRLVEQVRRNSSFIGDGNSSSRLTHVHQYPIDPRTNPRFDRPVPLSHSTTSTSKSTDLSYVSSLEPSEHVDALKNMITDGKSLNQAWKYYLEHFGYHVTQFPQSSSLKSVLSDLFKLIVESKRKSPFDSVLPSITTIAGFLYRRNSLSGRVLGDLITALLENISFIGGRSIDDKNLILDVVGAWVVGGNKSRNYMVHSPEDLKSLYQKHGIYCVFELTIPKLNKIDITSVPLAALAMFGVFTNNPAPIEDRIPEVTSLIETIAYIIDVPDLDIRSLDSANQSPALRSYVFKNWKKIRDSARQILDSKRKLEENQPTQERWTIDKSESIVSSPISQPRIREFSPIYHRLRTAVNLKNHALVDDLWSEVKTWPISKSENDIVQSNQEGVFSAEICNHFISAYMKLQRPATAIALWDQMVEKGLDPTLKTWNIMMLGCKAVNDWRSSEKIWKMILHIGLIPDTVNWSSRIHVLMDSKEIDMGIKALDEMGQQWIENASKKYPNLKTDELLLKEDVESVAKPDISCVNIAVAGLLGQGKRSMANKIVEWSRKFGIKPDTTTYNTFLRFFIRNGKNKEAMSLLGRMGKAEVEADVATFTIILDQVLRFPGQYSPEELKERVEGIFFDMEKANIRPNLHVYGRIIHQLVRDLDRDNTPAVEAVLKRMRNQGIQPSVHVYTSLIEFYLLQTPPSLEVARLVIDKATKIIGLDRVFWDRTIECYAQIGEIKIALNLIGELSTEKTRVGWSALRCVLNALYAQKEWNLARSFVRDIQKSASSHDYRTGTQGEVMFWQLAARLDEIYY
ncbi:Pentatricopeptide repeat-containing protein [Golovinomyces cichoracearum]|uniref:Pentatricopeptide repeat-containing protein n=1 Tax=Golovinomyces cichoracearum TaxID=62708 RepID=A0A420HFT5_9PEZI|nr:Pentatricopeptide repeat-containing protein [Golovinomyces cichoracearum]